MRSKCKRRTNAVQSASGDGCSPASSMRFKTNRSMVMRGQADAETCGGTGRLGGTKAQCGSASAETSTAKTVIDASSESRRKFTGASLCGTSPTGTRQTAGGGLAKRHHVDAAFAVSRSATDAKHREVHTFENPEISRTSTLRLPIASSSVGARLAGERLMFKLSQPSVRNPVGRVAPAKTFGTS